MSGTSTPFISSTQVAEICPGMCGNYVFGAEKNKVKSKNYLDCDHDWSVNEICSLSGGQSVHVIVDL